MMLLLAAALGAACVPVDGDRIGAAELAAADSAFVALPAEVSMGYAPAPGAHRTLAASDLSVLASRYGVKRTGTGSICFERRIQTLTPDTIAAAMRQSLGPETQVEVLDYMRAPVPSGALVFPLATLAAAADGTVNWRGFVKRGEQSKTPVWAKARVRASFRVVVAASDLKPGQPIPTEALREETRQGIPSPGTASIDQVAGRVPTRILRAGSPVSLEALAPPNDVERGEMVSVEVRCGAARLVLDALAGSDGRKGQLVTVRNPASGRMFRARVEERRRVLAVAGGCQ